MAEKKYQKYIIDDYRGRPPITDADREREPMLKVLPHICIPLTYLDSNKLEGGFYSECMWLHKASDAAMPAHAHEWDEIIGFFGSNPDDFHDLGGQIEFWLDDEQYILTKSCIIFIPKGLKHAPLIFRQVDHPIFHWGVGLSSIYNRAKTS
jgi:hypothetical protein